MCCLKSFAFFYFACFALLLQGSSATSTIGLPHTPSFKENKGQVSDQDYKPRPDVLFSGSDGQLAFHLKRNGISYQLSRVNTRVKPEEQTQLPAPNTFKKPLATEVTIYRIDVNWLNANVNAAILKQAELPGYDNYYQETCPAGALHVKSYGQISYQQLYPGIDLKWYAKNGHLKYDYTIAAGADYQQIQFEISGSEKISITPKGELLIKTPLGDLLEAPPTAAQNGRPLAARWLIKNKCVSFSISGFDAAQPFTIDPLVRLWGTYYGGTLEDVGCSIITDAAGNVFMAGETQSIANIATTGAQQNIFGGSSSSYGDAFLVKMDAAGNRLWGTYYGGTAADFANWCFVDVNGDVYMTGGTNTTNTMVIATPGAHQTLPTPGNGNSMNDAFLVKFNTSGIRQWGTYYGGNGGEWAFGGSADAFGNVYICGNTTSNNGTTIATPGSHQPANGGGYDGFIVQFNSAGVRQWGTYYGGSGADELLLPASDAAGNLYAVGDALSANAIATPGSHQPVYGGTRDAILIKFSMQGLRLWGTYYGGTGVDYGYSVQVLNNEVLIAGETSSNGSAIATPGSFQVSNGGNGDVYMAKFDLAGTRLWGTFYGGTGPENWGFAVADASGSIYLTGATSSSGGTVIATPCTYQDNFGGGARDAFLAKFTPSGARLWGTYYGGAGSEEWAYVNTDASGNVYLTGKTGSTAGMASSAAWQPVYGGGTADAFLVKFDGCIATSPPNTTPPPYLAVCSGNNTTLTTSLSCNISWFDASTGGTLLGTGSNYITQPLVITSSFFIEEFSCGSSAPRTAVTVTVLPLPQLTTASDPPLVCSGQSSTLTADGASTYTWLPPGNLSGSSGPTVVSSPAASTSYTVTGSDGTCTGSATIAVQVVPAPTPVISSAGQVACEGSGITLYGSGAQSFSWQPAGILSGSTGSVVNALPSASTVFTVTGINSSGTVVCTAQGTLFIAWWPYAAASVSGNQTICEGSSTLLYASGGSVYSWQPNEGLIDAGNNSVLASPLASTIYSVTVSSENACGSTKTVVVTVNPKPSLDAGRDTTFNLKEPMYVTATSNGSITWLGNTDIACNTCPSTQIFPVRKTCYVAQATSRQGCTATDEVCIDVATEYAIYIPNSFTPNQDELNEVFLVSGWGISNVQVSIYDRWGTQVFFSKDPQNGWNGTYKGQPCKTDTYVCIVEYTSANGKRHQESRHVNLLK